MLAQSDKERKERNQSLVDGLTYEIRGKDAVRVKELDRMGWSSTKILTKKGKSVQRYTICEIKDVPDIIKPKPLFGIFDPDTNTYKIYFFGSRIKENEAGYNDSDNQNQ
jgi:hypothetical protein